METRQFKENVKGAASYLQQQGFEVPHTQLLEAISRAFGERNWSTMRALLEAKPGVSSEPVPAPAPPLSDVAKQIVARIRADMWEKVYGICSRVQAESLVAAAAEAITPQPTPEEQAEALNELWVD